MGGLSLVGCVGSISSHSSLASTGLKDLRGVFVLSQACSKTSLASGRLLECVIILAQVDFPYFGLAWHSEEIKSIEAWLLSSHSSSSKSKSTQVRIFTFF